MEDLTDEEFEGIWVRIKKYIHTDEIKGVTKEAQRQELKRIMSKTTTKKDTATATMNFLEDHGFTKRAIETPKIRSELLATHIRAINIKGKTRFTLAKGTPTFIDTKGKQVKAGQFLSGKTESEATKALEKKSSS